MGLFETRSSGGGRMAALLGGIGIGAAIMYALDPQGGRRRRAMARDKAVSLAKETGKAVGARSRDLGNRAKGVAAEVRSVLAGKGTGKGNGGDATARAEGPGPVDRTVPTREFEEDGGL